MTINKLTADALVDGTLDSDAIGPASITTAKLNANIITGQTAIGAVDASNDLLLIYDNDATSLKKVPVSSVGATNTDSITEGSSNLYYTNARADARIANAIKDEDNMVSNSAIHVPSQQSVKAYVDTEVAGLVASAPGTLDTLNELAAALGDDANFSTTVTTSLAGKLPIAGGTMTGALNVSNDVYFSGQLGLGSSNATSPECQIFIAGDSTTTISDSDSLFGTNRNSFIKLENESSTSGVETGIILRAKQAGAGVWAIYAKHTGNYTGDLIFRGRNAQNTNAEVLRLTASGNVGIGTSSPNRQLVLYKNDSGQTQIQFQNQTTGTGSSDGFGVGLDTQEDGFLWNYEGGDIYFGRASTRFMTLVGSSGNVGIGETNPDGLLHVRGGTGKIMIQTDGAFAGTGEAMLDFRHYDDTGDPSGRISLLGTTNYTGDMVFRVRGGGTSGGGGAGLQEHMRIKSDNAGVEITRTSTDQTIGLALTNLQSGGYGSSIVFNSKRTDNNAIVEAAKIRVQGENSWNGASNVSSQITFSSQKDGTLTQHMVITKNSDVGIGVSGPSNQLHVYNGSATNYIRIENGTSGNMGGVYLKTSDNSDLNKFFRQQAYYTEIGAHNNEGVRFHFQGTNRYTFRGSNGGNVCYNAQNSSNWNTTSDERIKTNIKTLEDGAIDKIKALRPVTFDYTDAWAEHNDLHKLTNAPGKTEAEHYNITDHGIDEEKQKGQIGWIAQEYKTVFPNDVTIGEDTVGETKYDDFHTLNPESVVPTLVKALQEAVAKIDALETRIKTLES